MPDLEATPEAGAQPGVKRQSLGMYHAVRERWADRQSPEFKSMMRANLLQWREDPETVRIEHPTRIDRARELGYKAKQGIIVVRVRVRRGGQHKPAIRGGRRPKRKGIDKLTVKKSIQRMAEERASKKYPNMEVLNSYWVGEDGRYKWYEVILVDPDHPAIQNDPHLGWISDPANSDRANRGLTSAGKKGRGLRRKGTGAEKVRPSRRANIRKKLKRGRRTQRFVIGKHAPEVDVR